MMNNYKLLRDFNKYEVHSFLLKEKLNKNILAFFEDKDLKEHYIMDVSFEQCGEYIIITDCSASDSHIPLNIIWEFCDEFGVELKSISHEVSEQYVRNSSKTNFIHSNVYEIWFELIDDK